MWLKGIFDRGTTFAQSPVGKKGLRWMRLIFITGIIGLLVYQLSRIGWMEVLRSLPVQPAFYVLLLAMYFLLPISESLIYGRLWHVRAWDCLSIMLRKRVLNMDIVGYSGEVYLFSWAKSRLAEGPRRIMATIKDNLIVTSGASIVAASSLLAGLLVTGHLRVSDLVADPNPVYVAVGAFAAGLLASLAYRFRRVLFSLPRRTIAWIAGVHTARFFLGYALQVAHWWVVIPSASFETWAVLLTVSVLINRIPFLPSSDLVFVSAGAGLTPLLGIPVAPVVGMLLVRSATDRLLNLIFFTTSVWQERRRVYSREDSAADSLLSEVGEAEELPSEITAPLNS